MADEDALHGEMRRLHGLGPTNPPPLDQDTVERMLAGTVDPADAPPGYAGVVRVLAAAAAEPTAAELAGEAEAVVAFRAARRPLDPSRRKPVFGKLAGVKALVAVAAGVVTVGTAAAAATGSLPSPAQQVAHRLVAAVPAPAESVHPASSRPSSAATAGAVGLCRAWAAGQGGEHGKKLDATAFDRLATAAGGAAKVSAYCATLTGATARSQAAHPNAARPSHQPANAALVGLCRGWLAADEHGQTERLGKAVRDRLSTAAGGADKVTAYCGALVAASAANTHTTTKPAAEPTPSAPVPTGSAAHRPTAPPMPPTHS